MKKIIFLILFLIPNLVYADRVCLEKATGKLIEYQSTNAPLGTLIQNAINSGYKKEDVEEKYVTKEEWEIIEEKHIKKPAREKMAQEEIERQQKEDAIKLKLNLSTQDWENLKKALGK